MAISLSSNPTAVGATISSAGLGSNLDVATIVPQLVNAEVGAKQTRLTTQQANNNTTISALGSVKSALSSLQTAVDSLTSGTALTGRSATSGDTTVFSASASTSASVGTYAIQVTTIAQTNTITSNAFTNSSTVVGDGNITINAGGSAFQVTLSPGSDTLADLRDAINKSANNTGVTATIVNASDGAHLLLSSTQTGLANAVSVSSPFISFTSSRPAANASITINGLPYTSSSNTITDAIDGVTLNLASQKPGTDVSLTVGPNTAGAIGAVQSFVSAYNAALTLVNKQTAYDASTQTGGVLLSDVAMQSLDRQLQSIISTSLTAPVNGVSLLSQIGVKSNSDGTLSVDSGALTTALTTNPQAVKALLTSSTGATGSLDTLLNGYLNTGGIIDGEVQGLQSQIKDITTQLANLNERAATLTQQYTTQFNSIGTKVSQYTNISNYMTQLVAQWTPKSSG